MALSSFLDPIFDPLLSLNPLLAVAILTFIISLIIVVIYKYTTNQKLMKELKDELKKHQDDMKKHKDNPDKMMEIQKSAMESNMKYMTHSFRATLFTFLPIIILFGWMGAHYAWQPIMPNQQFNILLGFDNTAVGNVTIDVPAGMSLIGPATVPTNTTVTYTLTGAANDYSQNNSIRFEYNNKIFYKDVLITDKLVTASKDTLIKDSDLKVITLNYKKLIILPYLNWGWLGTYIILSLIFSMVLRKVLNVY